MNKIFVVLCGLVVAASANLNQVKEILGEVEHDAEILLSSPLSLEAKENMANAMTHLKTIRSLQPNEFTLHSSEFSLSSSPSNKSLRSKRQTSLNCDDLKAQLIQTQAEIATTNDMINSTTSTLRNLNTNIVNYQLRTLTSTGALKAVNLRYLKLYQKLYNATSITLSALQTSLLNLQADADLTKTLIDAYCNRAANPCGTFSHYNPTTDRTDPEVYGFAGGDNLDNTIAYVGFDMINNCEEEALAPCSISTNVNSAGCSIICGSDLTFDNTGNYYLEYHSKLSWIPTNTTAMLNYPNAIKIAGPSNFMIGRTDVGGKKYLGRVLAGYGSFEFQTITANGLLQLTSGFDILTCEYENVCAATSEPTTTQSSQTSLTEIQSPETTASYSTPATTTAKPCNDTIQTGQCIPFDGKTTLSSCNGCFNLLFQDDGNLVLYYSAPGYPPIWASNTYPAGKNACMQTDGNFVIYNVNGGAVYATNTGGSGVVAKIQNDAQFTVLEGNGTLFTTNIVKSCI